MKNPVPSGSFEFDYYLSGNLDLDLSYKDMILSGLKSYDLLWFENPESDEQPHVITLHDNLPPLNKLREYHDRFKEKIESLEEQVSLLTPELRVGLISALNKATEEIVLEGDELRISYPYLIGQRFLETRKTYPKEAAAWLKRAHTIMDVLDFLCFRKFSRQTDQKVYDKTKTVIGWGITSRLADAYSSKLSQDASFFASHGNPKFSQRLGDLESFYRTISSASGYNEQRSRILLDDMCTAALEIDKGVIVKPEDLDVAVTDLMELKPRIQIIDSSRN